MKADILKFTGLTEEQFYKKYKTPSAWEKSNLGKKFKSSKKQKISKAQPGIEIPNLQQLGQNPFQTNYIQDTQIVADAQLNQQYPGLMNPSFQMQQNFPVTGNAAFQGATAGLDSGNSVGSDQSSGFNTAGAMSALGGLASGVSNYIAQGKRAKELKQQKLVTGVLADAMSSQDVDINRQIADNIKRQRQMFMPITTGEEFGQVNGVGSNPLAKNGTQIQNTYAPNTLYNDLGYEPLQNYSQEKSYEYGGKLPKASIGMGQITGPANSLIQSGFNNNAGSQIGSSVGQVTDMFLPGSSLATTALFGALDNAIGTGGKLKKEQKGLGREQGRMIASAYSSADRQANSSYKENGGQINSAEYGTALDGTLAPMWGGSIKDVSYNPFTGPMAMGFGNDHDEYDGKGNSGIGMQVLEEGGQPGAEVEIQTKEPIIDTGDSKTVLGGRIVEESLKKQIGVKGNTYQKIGENIGNNDNKLNKKKEKISEELLDKDVDALKLKSFEMMDLGITAQQKKNAESLLALSAHQNVTENLSKKLGYDDVNKFDKDFKKNKLDFTKLKNYSEDDMDNATGKYGLNIPKAENGKRLTIQQAKAQGYKKNAKGEWTKLTKKGTPEKVEIIPATEAVYKEIKGRKVNAPGKGSDEFNKAYAEARNKKLKEFPFKGKMYTTDIYDPETQSTQAEQKLVTAATPEEKKVIAATPDEYDSVEVYNPETKPVDYKRNILMDVANEILPYTRPSDARNLDASQLYGEMYALSNNQLEPVQARGYRPQLDVPFDISLQDQLNEVTAQTRATQKLMGYNPGAQANLAAQAYGAKSGILGEQFRMNQANKDRVYSGNRQIMNDAQLKNLNIFDTQYGRQAQAKSNTKDVTQAALNSMSSKYAQNALENKTLQAYENMYNYRFGNDMRAQNMNGFQQFNIPNVGSQEGQTQVPIYDAEGNITGYQLTTKPTLATQGFNPTADAKNGKTIKKTILGNGSLVKSLKNI